MLYIDGNDVGYSNGTTAFYAMLGASFGADGAALSTIPVSGQSGTITASKNYTIGAYTYNVSFSVDEIEPTTGTAIFKCNEGKTRAVIYQDPVKKYKVIYSAFFFGAIRGIPEKNALMKIYMDWLMGGTEILSDKPITLNTPGIILDAALLDRTVLFSVSAPAAIRVNLYTVSGKLVDNIADAIFSAGRFQYGLDPALGTASYVLRVETGKTIVNKKVSLTK